MARRASFQWFVRSGAAVISFGMGLLFLACSSEHPKAVPDVGEAEVALTNAPSDVRCLRLTVEGPSRTDVRTFPLVSGQRSVFRLQGLPVGQDTFTADAFSAKCENLNSGADPTWYSEPVVARLRAGVVTHVSIHMIHNGGASVGVDFGDGNGPSGSGGEEPPLEGGAHSSQDPYLSALGCPVQQTAVFTTGDTANFKPDGKTPYRLVGVPDGLGAFDNGDGTFTLLVNHGLPATAGVVRAHGARGAFVSKWTVRKADLAMMNGSDLIQRAALWNTKASAYDPPIGGVTFNTFSSGNLPQPSALFDEVSQTGFDGRLFFNGEEIGDEGRAWVHGLDGTSYEFPRMGKASWENIVPNPGTGKRTLVAGLDDSGAGQVYMYLGDKTNSGNPAARAGLTNGALFGVKVTGFPTEVPASGIPDGTRFTLAALGNVENRTGAELQAASVASGVTGFQRPEDGEWDPNNPNDFYFVTTAAFNLPSRLWRLRFDDVTRPDRGGVIDMLLDGTEGQHMLDNVAVDHSGHVYLQEDPGSNAYLAKVWRYDIGSDQLSEVQQASSALFSPGGAAFLTIDEESSGIIDMSDILGPGRFLSSTQVHAANRDQELVEGGQLSLMFDNDGLGSVMASLATLMVQCTGTIGPDSFVLNADGFLQLPDNFRCTTNDGIAQRKDGAIRSYLSLQFPRPETVRGDPQSRLVVPNAKECIAGRWASWREAFRRTGITQAQCPLWTETGRDQATPEEQADELAKSANTADEEGARGQTRTPPNLDLFKVFRDFAVAFGQARPDHACTGKGPAACAALCAGAFPGFVIAANGEDVRIDAMEWLEDDTYPSGTDPFLQLGYYHPMWSYGETFGNRMRANTCGNQDKLFQACNKAVGGSPAQLRSCLEQGCASELCSVALSTTTFQKVRFRLNCLLPVDQMDPKDPNWLTNWDTCVAHCYLPP